MYFRQRSLVVIWIGIFILGTRPSLSQHQTFTSPNTEVSGFFGYDVAVVGDLTSDGTPELIVGAYQEDNSGMFDTGRAYIVNGATGAAIRTFTSPNAQAYSHFGYAVAGIGDVSGDGIADVAIGASNENSGAGRAYVFNGSTGALLRTLVSPDTQNNGSFGKEVSALADVTGDGVGDLIVGADNEDTSGSAFNGRAYVFNGATGALVHTLDTPNPAIGGRFGEHAVDMGDVTGDGVSEIAVGAHNEQNTERGDGSVYVFNGATGARIYTLTSPNASSLGSFGWYVASMGDITGDGRNDLIVGSFETLNFNTSAGRSYIFNGASGALVRTLTSPSPEGFGYYGFAACGIPDQNGDSVPDIAIGAYAEDTSSFTNDGKIYITSGANGSVLDTIESPAAEVEGNFSYSMAYAGTNGSGNTLLVVGAHREQGSGSMDEGRAHLVNVTASALPVELTAFEAIQDGRDIWLRWTTASETNNAGFDIEYQHVKRSLVSQEKATWRSLGFVEGKGTTIQSNQYQFFVGEHSHGHYRYRLRQIDYDGTVSYSQTVELTPALDTQLSLELYPNPLKETGTLSFTLPEATQGRVEIFDMMGRKFYEMVPSFASETSVHQQTIDAAHWAAGVYLVRLHTDRGVKTQSLLVQR